MNKHNETTSFPRPYSDAFVEEQVITMLENRWNIFQIAEWFAKWAYEEGKAEFVENSKPATTSNSGNRMVKLSLNEPVTYGKNAQITTGTGMEALMHLLRVYISDDLIPTKLEGKIRELAERQTRELSLVSYIDTLKVEELVMQIRHAKSKEESSGLIHAYGEALTTELDKMKKVVGEALQIGRLYVDPEGRLCQQYGVDGCFTTFPISRYPNLFEYINSGAGVIDRCKGEANE